MGPAEGQISARGGERGLVSGPMAPYLITSPDQPPVVSYMSPVEQAIASGAPAPTSDDEVKALYEMAYGEMPVEQQGFIDALLPSAADRATVSSPSGLLISFAVADFEDEVYIDASIATADAIAGLQLSPGYSTEAFSMELIFGGTDEFQNEISRLFASAGFIILLVLTILQYRVLDRRVHYQ